MFVEKSVVILPLWLYPTQTFILGSFPTVSTWLIAKAVIPFNLTAYFRATKSSHPHLLGLFVVVPYSWPSSRIVSPISLSCSVT